MTLPFPSVRLPFELQELKAAPWQVSPTMQSVAREESGWMELLQFVTPSSTAATLPYRPELDPTTSVAFLEAYQVNAPSARPSPRSGAIAWWASVT